MSLNPILLPTFLDDTNWRDFACRGRESCAQQLKSLTRNLLWFALREYLRAHPEAHIRFNYSRENNSDPYPAIILIDVNETDPTKKNNDLFNLNVVMNTFCYETGAADVELWMFAKMLYESKIVFNQKNIENYRHVFFTKEQQAVATDRNLRIVILEEGLLSNVEYKDTKKI